MRAYIHNSYRACIEIHITHIMHQVPRTILRTFISRCSLQITSQERHLRCLTYPNFTSTKGGLCIRRRARCESRGLSYSLSLSLSLSPCAREKSCFKALDFSAARVGKLGFVLCSAIHLVNQSELLSWERKEATMASLFKDQNKLSAYRDRRFPGSQEEFELALRNSTTLYIGNMSFYTTEEQVYELFTRAGEIKKIIMGLDKNTKTPCGFCFVLYYSRADAEDSVKYISGTILDDRPIRVDFDWGFQEGRQWGRGRSGGQVRDEYRTDYDPGRGGYGKLVQRELEEQRNLVDYGVGSLGSFQPVAPSYYGRHGGDYNHGGSHRHGRDYHRKRYREDDRHTSGRSRRTNERERDSERTSDHESRPEKNPRFRESGDSDEEDDDDKKRRH